MQFIFLLFYHSPSCVAVVKRAGHCFVIVNLRSRVRVRAQATAPFLIRTFGMDSLSLVHQMNANYPVSMIKLARAPFRETGEVNAFLKKKLTLTRLT